jgi:thiol-disulfide isomerase/thioredoxin
MAMLNRWNTLLLAALAFNLPVASLTASEISPGQTAPNCALSPLGGGSAMDLKKYKGKVVYVDFWASWCGPCAQSFPYMNKLHSELHGKGLEIIGVNLDEELAEAQAFLAKTPAKFTVLADAGGQCPQDFGVKAMPSSYLIDRQGVVRHVHLGFKPTEAEQLRKQVEALLDAQ